MNILEIYREIRSKLVFPNKGVNFEPSDSLYDMLESGGSKDLQQVVDKMSAHIGLRPPIAEYEWSIKLTPEIAGLYHFNRIVIPVVMAGNKYALGQILAHELAHHFAHHHKLVLRDRMENERLTDILSIIIGFGKYVLCGKNTVDDVYTSHSLGYITHEEMCMVYQRYVIDFGIEKGFKGLTSHANAAYARFMKNKK